MKSHLLSRRAVLRGLGATVSLPLLDVVPAFAAGTAVGAQPGAAGVNRMAYLYFPNGIPRGIWYPEETTADGRLVKLNEWMSPLESHKHDILIPSNMWTPEGNGHVNGPPTWLTGQRYDSRKVNAGGVSVDQVAANHLRGRHLNCRYRVRGIFRIRYRGMRFPGQHRTGRWHVRLNLELFSIGCLRVRLVARRIGP